MSKLQIVFHLLGVLSLSCSLCPAIPKGFVSIADYDPTIIHEIRYGGFHNFVGRIIRGYDEPLCILTEQAARALSAAQKEFMSMKPPYSIKVYDCYRPQMAVDDFVEWAKDLNDTKMKEEFYPYLNKSVLFPRGYIAEKSGHSRGSTSDLTIVPWPPEPEPGYYQGMKLLPCTNRLPFRYPDNSIDMGTGFDCFDELAHTNNTNITTKEKENRILLKKTLTKHNFTNYWAEWWHYTLNNEPFPNTYFNFSIKCK